MTTQPPSTGLGDSRVVEHSGPPPAQRAGGPPPGPHPGDDRSLGDLFGELASETTTLVRQEIALAKTEITNDAKEAGKDAGMAVAGGALAYAGLIVLLMGLGWGLGRLLGELEWLGITLMGLIVVGVGYALVQSGLTKLRKIDPVPERTIKTLKEDKEWLKNETP